MNNFDFMVGVLSERTVIGDPTLLQREGLTNERPFDPQIWWENGYNERLGREYIGPSDVDDLHLLREYLEDRRAVLDTVNGLDPFGGEPEAILWSLTGVALAISDRAYLPAVVSLVGFLGNRGHAITLEEIQGIATYEDLLREAELECFGAGTSISLWPMETKKTKPIEDVSPGDVVVAFDKLGHLAPGKVTRVFSKKVKIVLDFWGTFVTPGHVYLRADHLKTRKFETLVDILRSDGVVQSVDGSLIRAATGLVLDDWRDGFVVAVTGEKIASGIIAEVCERKKIRLGTRIITEDGNDVCIADIIVAAGGSVNEDGLVSIPGKSPAPFHWTFSKELPKPEDYVLKRSNTTLEEIYKAAEWEEQQPYMPAPVTREGGLVQPLPHAKLSILSANAPLVTQNDSYTPNRAPNLRDNFVLSDEISGNKTQR